MMEVITITLIVAVSIVAWLVWTEPKSKQALDKDDASEQAWREVLDNDVNYTERQQFEARKPVGDDEHRGAAAARH